jgi:hypothetical protein
MNWRERAREIQKCPPGGASKVSKGPFEPFETTQDATSGSFRHPSGDTTLADFRAALVLGRLVVCCNCTYFTAGAEPGGLGRCRQFAAETWAFVPFVCGGFTVSPRPAAPAYLPDSDGARAIAGQTGRNPISAHRRAS